MSVSKKNYILSTMLLIAFLLLVCTYQDLHDFIAQYIRIMWVIFITFIIYYIFISRKLFYAHNIIQDLTYSVDMHKRDLYELEKLSQKNRAKSDVDYAQDAITKSDYIVNISHELCAPLNAIVGYADLLTRTTLTDKQKHYIDSILHSGQLMSELAQEITTLANLESGEITIKNQVFKIGNVLEDVLEIMGNRASLKKIDIICEYNEIFESECLSDPVRIRQILINLVSNAIKYTHKGHIILKVYMDHLENGSCNLHLDVTDTGIGISKQDQGKIFTPFFQLEKEYTHNRNESGAGLGLTINKRLVQAMGGTMGVESEKEKGARFWVSLPCKFFNTSKTDILAHYTSINSRKALVIEDNTICCDAIIRDLEYFGVLAESAFNIESARALIKTTIDSGTIYDFVIISSRLDSDCSLKFAMEIRNIPEYRALPFVITVPISEPLAVGLVSRVQPAFCINKPVIPSKFKDALARVMRILEKNTDDIMVDTNGLISSGSFNDRKILVIDDNPVNRKLLLELLYEIRFIANAAADGQTALDLLYTPNPHRYDLVILDCQLPGMDGFEIAGRIRNLNLEKQPVIIMTSADNTVNNQLKCYKAGADDFIEKPITHDSLINCLLSWLPAEMRTRLQDGLKNRTVVNIFNAPVLDDGIINMIKLMQERKDNFVSNLYKLFIDDTSLRIDGIMRNIKLQNYDEIIRASHAIKSGCMQFGARRMSRCCDVLGNMAKNRNIEEIESSLNLLIHEYNRVMSEFETYQTLVELKD